MSPFWEALRKLQNGSFQRETRSEKRPQSAQNRLPNMDLRKFLGAQEIGMANRPHAPRGRKLPPDNPYRGSELSNRSNSSENSRYVISPRLNDTTRASNLISLISSRPPSTFRQWLMYITQKPRTLAVETVVRFLGHPKRLLESVVRYAVANRSAGRAGYYHPQPFHHV